MVYNKANCEFEKGLKSIKISKVLSPRRESMLKGWACTIVSHGFGCKCPKFNIWIKTSVGWLKTIVGLTSLRAKNRLRFSWRAAKSCLSVGFLLFIQKSKEHFLQSGHSLHENGLASFVAFLLLLPLSSLLGQSFPLQVDPFFHHNGFIGQVREQTINEQGWGKVSRKIVWSFIVERGRQWKWNGVGGFIVQSDARWRLLMMMIRGSSLFAWTWWSVVWKWKIVSTKIDQLFDLPLSLNP